MIHFNNTSHAIGIVVFASVLATTFGAQHAHAADATPASGVFAVVDGVSLPQAQLDAVVHNVTARTGQADTAQLRAELTQALIARELLRQAAQKANYAARPEVQAATVDAETQLYAKEHVQPQTVTDAQVKASYDRIVASFGKEQFRPSLISVSDTATAQKVMAALKSGQGFATLARQYSVVPSKAAGGALPWVSFPVPAVEGRTQGLPLPVAQAISTLNVGGVTPEPLQVGNMWVIVKLDEKRPVQTPSFDQLKNEIRQQLQTQAEQKAMADLNASLLKAATVQQ